MKRSQLFAISTGVLHFSAGFTINVNSVPECDLNGSEILLSFYYCRNKTESTEISQGETLFITLQKHCVLCVKMNHRDKISE
jgi:hypothetical protein